MLHNVDIACTYLYFPSCHKLFITHVIEILHHSTDIFCPPDNAMSIFVPNLCQDISDMAKELGFCVGFCFVYFSLFENKKLHFQNIGTCGSCCHSQAQDNWDDFASDFLYDFDCSGSLSVFIACRTWEIISSRCFLLVPSGRKHLTLCLYRLS